MKFAFFWLGFIALASALSWIYQPTLNLVVISASVLIALAGVVAWSAVRMRHGQNVFFKVLLVSLVAGFMHTQAMDIAYSVTFAPAGGRFPVLLETLILGLLLALNSVLFARLILRPQEDEKPQSN